MSKALQSCRACHIFVSSASYFVTFPTNLKKELRVLSFTGSSQKGIARHPNPKALQWSFETVPNMEGLAADPPRLGLHSTCGSFWNLLSASTWASVTASV